MDIVRSNPLIISFRTVYFGLINEQIHSIALSEAQQALADYVRLLGCGRSPRAQLFFSDRWVLLDFIVRTMQRQDHLIYVAWLCRPSFRHHPGRVVLAKDRTTDLRDADLRELLACGLLVLTAE